MQIPTAAATPSAVRSSGRIQRGRRRAIAVSTRFSWRARRKLGSRVALTADIDTRIPLVGLLTNGQQPYSQRELQLQRRIAATAGRARHATPGGPVGRA